MLEVCTISLGEVIRTAAILCKVAIILLLSPDGGVLHNHIAYVTLAVEVDDLLVARRHLNVCVFNGQRSKQCLLRVTDKRPLQTSHGDVLNSNRLDIEVSFIEDVVIAIFAQKDLIC